MIVKDKQQYAMKKDFFQLALIEWRKEHPTMKRESDVDREWVLRKARELEQRG
jgi:hypothetical protein